MDSFIKKIQSFNDNITPSQQIDFTKSHIRNKQILIYYLYRILCKYRIVFKRVVKEAEINNIYKVLGVPIDDNCYPLGNKLTNSIEVLDVLINSMLAIFLKYSEQGNSIKIKEAQTLNEFIKYKISEENIIIEDLAKINILVPNLAKSETKPEPSEIDKMVGISS